MGGGGLSSYFVSECRITPFHNEEDITNSARVISEALLMRILDPCFYVNEIMDFCQSIMFCTELYV